MRSIYHTPHLAEATLIRTFLEEHGISAVVQGSMLQDDTSTNPTTAVWVADEDADRAEDLLARHPIDAKDEEG